MALPKPLMEYIQTHVPKAGSEAVRKALLEAGWEPAIIDEGLMSLSPEEEALPLKKEKVEQKAKKEHHWNWLRLLSLAGILIVGVSTIGGLAYAYFFLISPTFVSMPDVNTPELSVNPFDTTQSVEKVEITPDQMEYLAVAVDAYKLHPHPATGDLPKIEYIVTDTGEAFSITIVENKAEVKEEITTNPDIRILGSKRTFLQLIAEQDPAGAIERYAQEKLLGVEILADEQTLLLKGYKAIYDSLQNQ